MLPAGGDVQESAFEAAVADAPDPLAGVGLDLRGRAAGPRAAVLEAGVDHHVAGQAADHLEQPVLRRGAGDRAPEVDDPQRDVGARPHAGDLVDREVGDRAGLERGRREAEDRVAVGERVAVTKSAAVSCTATSGPGGPAPKKSPITRRRPRAAGESAARVPGGRRARGELRADRAHVGRADDVRQLRGRRHGGQVGARQARPAGEAGDERAQRGQAARVGDPDGEQRHALERGDDVGVERGEQRLHLGDGRVRRPAPARAACGRTRPRARQTPHPG